jgi:hypothetical protein
MTPFVIFKYQLEKSLSIITSNLPQERLDFVNYLELLFKTKTKNNVYLYTFQLNDFYEIINKEERLQLFKISTFEYQAKVYLIEIYYPVVSKHKIIIKDIYNFISPEYLKDSFINNVMLIYAIFEDLWKAFNIDLNSIHILSTPAIGFNIYRKHFKDQYKLISQMNSTEDAYIRNAFFGGRNEVFKPLCLHESYYYDINSLYPYIMKTCRMPIGNPIYCENTYFGADFVLESFYGFLDVLISIDNKNTCLPVLPFKLNFDSKNTIDDTSEGIIYPKGFFRNIYFSEELKLAVSKGYKIIKIFSGYKYEQSGILFDQFVDVLYSKRFENTPQKTDAIQAENIIQAKKNFYKKMLNSFYGRWAIAISERQYYAKDFDNIIDPYLCIDPETTDFISVRIRNKKNNISIACAIAGYARIFMYQIIDKNKLDLFYWDTDGIFISKPLPTFLVSTTKEIGKFRLISRNQESFFISGKLYSYTPCSNTLGESKPIYVFRGVQQPFEIISHNELLWTFKKVLKETLRDKVFLMQIRVRNPEKITYEFNLYKKRKIIYHREIRKYLTKPWVIQSDSINRRI